MRKDSVIAYFGGIQKTMAGLSVTERAVRRWGDLVPPEMAIKAYCVSNGELFLDPWLYHDWPTRGRVTDKTTDRRFKRNQHRPPRELPR
jgi:hypothetical protein